MSGGLAGPLTALKGFRSSARGGGGHQDMLGEVQGNRRRVSMAVVGNMMTQVE